MEVKKIKVVHHMKGCGYSGTDRTAQLFCQYINKDKFDPYIVYRANADCSRVDVMKSILGDDHVIEYEHEHGENISPYLPKHDTLVQVLRSIDPDIIHFHRSGYSEWPCLCFLVEEFPRTKFVETNIFAYNDNFSWNLRLFICPYIARKAGHPDGNWLYNPVELPYYEKDYERPTTGPIILGRIGRQDNFCDISLQACRMLLERGITNWEYHIVNGCENWVKKAKELGVDAYCKFLPAIHGNEALSQFYASLDIFAHARSDGECQSVCISESQIHGVPVITHESPCWNGQVDQVQLSQCGFCVDWQDANAYANHLQALIKDKSLRERYGCNGQSWAKENIEASVIARKLEKYYEGLL